MTISRMTETFRGSLDRGERRADAWTTFSRVERTCRLAVRIQKLGLFVGRALGRELCRLSQMDGRDGQNRPNDTTQNRTGVIQSLDLDVQKLSKRWSLMNSFVVV